MNTNASVVAPQTTVVKILPNDKGNPPGKLADAELHFVDGDRLSVDQTDHL